MAYVKLARGVENGEVFFTLPAFYERKHALRIPEGAVIPVEWSDGSRTQARIAYQESVVRVCGYKRKQSVAGVLTSTKGIPTWIPLDQVRVPEECFRRRV